MYKMFLLYNVANLITKIHVINIQPTSETSLKEMWVGIHTRIQEHVRLHTFTTETSQNCIRFTIPNLINNLPKKVPPVLREDFLII